MELQEFSGSEQTYKENISLIYRSEYDQSDRKGGRQSICGGLRIY
jgi:hypothetical protein